MERYLGIDVHKESCSICVLSATGKKVRGDVVETHGQALVRYVQQIPGSLHICLEETEWSEWLYEILSPHASELVVYQAKWEPGSKSDAIDAHGLADKLRIGKVGTPIFKAPARFRKLRECARIYQALAKDVGRTKNRLNSLYRRRGVAVELPQIYDPARRDRWVRELPAPMRPGAELLGRELDGLEELKAEANRAMQRAARRHRITRILSTVPGLGPVRVPLLMAIVVTPQRFRTKRQFWAYCGFGIVTRSSADWVRVNGQWVKQRVALPRGLNPNHHPVLKDIFKGAATTAIHRAGPNPFRGAYQRLCDRGTKPNLAKLTVARKMAATVLAMWKREEVYDPERSPI